MLIRKHEDKLGEELPGNKLHVSDSTELHSGPYTAMKVRPYRLSRILWSGPSRGRIS